MKLLARQLKFLEAQREFLEYKASLASEESLSTVQLLQNRRDAVQEKKRLVEAQLHQEMLTKVATQQLENLKFIELMLLQTPVSHYVSGSSMRWQWNLKLSYGQRHFISAIPS
jgi:hypothetical protein